MTLYRALSWVSAWLLLCGSLALIVEPQVFYQGLALVFFVLARLCPMRAIALFLGFMPLVAGDQPGSQNTIHFLELLSVLLLALVLRDSKECKGPPVLALGAHPLVFALIVYWLVAGLSLVTILPQNPIWALLWPDPEGAYAFMAQNECAAMYPWLAWYQLSLGLLFGLLLLRRLHVAGNWAVHWTLSLLAGLLFSEVLGILDFYGAIDLNPFRSVPGRALQHQSLTSLFGNPGWYAQFITVATPAVLSLLSLRLRHGLRLGAMLFVMVLSEFTLILVHQRGGWLSYPLTLLVVWLCIYTLREGHQTGKEVRERIRRLAPKILISFPLTILLSVGLVFLIAKVSEQLAVPIPDANVYIERAKSIKNTSNRLAYLDPISTMVHRHPLLGYGNESYCGQFESLYGGTSPPLKLSQWAIDNDIMNGSAHNLYFQAVAGKGIVGLLSLLGLIFVAVRTAWRSMFEIESTGGTGLGLSYVQRLVLMMGFSYTMALAIYGNVGEMFYTPIGYLLLGFFFAVMVGLVPSVRPIHRKTPMVVGGLLLTSLLAHLYWEYVDPAMSKSIPGAPSGCYQKEENPLNPLDPFHWCSKSFTLKLKPRRIKDQSLLYAHIGVPKPEGYPDTVHLVAEFEGLRLADLSLPTGTEKDLWMSLPFSSEQEVAVDFRVDRAFIPVTIPSMASSDSRTLGVQWYLDHGATGCYSIEGDTSVPASLFRWCRQNFKAKLPLSLEGGACRGRMVLAAQTLEGHPPTRVRMTYQGELLLESPLVSGEISPLDFSIPVSGSSSDCPSELEVEVSSNDFFVPALEIKGSGDGRDLSLRWYVSP